MRNHQNGSVLIVVIAALFVLFLGLVAWRWYDATQPPVSVVREEKTATPTKRIVAAGDIACDPSDSNRNHQNPAYCQDDQTARLAQGAKPDAVLALGDLQYDNGTLEKFQQAYAATWGTLRGITHPAPGNHEYATSQAGGYYAYFQDAPQDIRAGYYSFTLGNWRIISLNSNCDHIGGCGSDSAQMHWLQAELRNHPAPCTLAFWHHPRFTSGNYRNDTAMKSRSETMWNLLATHHVDVVLNGHDHLYERFAPQTPDGTSSAEGMRQFTVGTGGKSHYRAAAPVPQSEKIVDDRFGILQMDLFLGSYAWQFIATDNTVLDAGQQQCVR